MSDIFEKYINKAKSYNEVNIQSTKTKSREALYRQRKEDPEEFSSRKFKLGKEITDVINNKEEDLDQVIIEIISVLKPDSLTLVEQAFKRLLADKTLVKPKDSKFTDDNDAA